MVRAVLFDFDGVLTLDATGTTSICNYIAAVTGIDRELFTKEYRKFNAKLLYGICDHIEVWDNICEGVNSKIDINVLYDSFLNTPLDEEMLLLVHDLKDRGYIVGIITDNKKDRIDMISNHFEFYDYFDYIIVSSEIGSGKDNNAIFKKTLDDLLVSPHECVFIDNNEENLQVPKEMGMSVLFFDHKNRDIVELKRQLQSFEIKL